MPVLSRKLPAPDQLANRLSPNWRIGGRRKLLYLGSYELMRIEGNSRDLHSELVVLSKHFL